MTCLRRLASILLLGLLLFNWVGYRLVTSYLQEQADRQLQASLEKNNYQEEDLVEIRVPLNLPYQTDWKEFQPYDGEVRVDGVDYRYVKRKVEKGQLVLLCLPNHTKTHLATARDQFFMLVNDLQQRGHAKSDTKVPIPVKSPVTDYWHQYASLDLAAPIASHVVYGALLRAICLPGHFHAPVQPPDFTL